jgi:hypothetical protein
MSHMTLQQGLPNVNRAMVFLLFGMVIYIFHGNLILTLYLLVQIFNDEDVNTVSSQNRDI